MPGLGLDPNSADDRGQLSAQVYAALGSTLTTMEDSAVELLPEPKPGVARL